MNEHKDRYSTELAGSLTPELEGASHSMAHAARLPRARPIQAEAAVNTQRAPKPGAAPKE